MRYSRYPQLNNLELIKQLCLQYPRMLVAKKLKVSYGNLDYVIKTKMPEIEDKIIRQRRKHTKTKKIKQVDYIQGDKSNGN